MDGQNKEGYRKRLKEDWVTNIRVPAQTLRDKEDEIFLKDMRECYGETRVYIGPPQAAEGFPARYWEERGMDGLYLSGPPRRTLRSPEPS
jgi:hypothetical protein